ncbi:hypothetical protein KM043_006652 [Ampulex compressa]|nr:hypothetical protein KM043_006652 [Ampulex compressa]
MGQVMGQMPDTLHEILEEKDRVLQLSGEVISRVNDNITNEDTFLMDYDDEKIDAKVAGWLQNDKTRLEEIFEKYPNASDNCKNQITSKVDKISEELKTAMRNDYQSGYSDIKKFTKKVDKLGKEQRKIHGELQELEEGSAGDVKKFKKKFGPLRTKVFDNLQTGEKMMFEDKRLKTAFSKKVYDIDHAIAADCTKKFDKLIKEFEKCAVK